MKSLPLWLQTVISPIPKGALVGLLAGIGGITLVAGVGLLKRGRRHLVDKYRAGEFHAGENTFVYLRPFVADTTSLIRYTTGPDFFELGIFDMRFWTGLSLQMRLVVRYEELVAYAFRRVGTLVAVGDPTEKLPQLGATRVYVGSSGSTGSKAEDSWKTEVAEQIAGAKLILLHVGFSEAIRWEIGTVVEVADPQRVVLCVNPPGKRKPSFRNNLDSARRAEVNILWKDFREACGAVFPRGLPETIGDARFVKFDANWTAKPVQAKRRIAWFLPASTPRPRRDSIDGALVWLSWLMVPERVARRLARRFINAATFVIAIVVVIFVLIALFSRP